MDIIGVVKYRIEKISSNDMQKNVLSLLYIMWLLILTIIFIKIFVDILVIPFFIQIKSFIETLRKNIIINFEMNNIYIDITYLTISFIKLIFPIFIMIIYVKYFEKFRFKTELIYMVINIILTMCLFFDIRIIFLIMLVILLLTLIVPLSSGRYFEVLKMVRYLMLVFKEQNIKINDKLILKILIKCFLVIIVCFFISYLSKPFISFFLVFFLCITFAARIYMSNNSDNKVLDIIIKIILYIFVICTYCFLNKKLTAEIDRLLGLIITIYFAWDRLFSISKDIEDLIDDKCVLFYYEEKIISEKKLSNRYLNFNFINKGIDEKQIVIQVLIRFNLINYKPLISENIIQIKNEIIELCKLYDSLDYKSYYLLVGYIGILINKEQLTEKEYFVELEELFDKSESVGCQKIYPLDAIYEYIGKLCNEEKYEKVILLYKKYLARYVKTLDKNILSTLIESAQIVNKPLYEELKIIQDRG